MSILLKIDNLEKRFYSSDEEGIQYVFDQLKRYCVLKTYKIDFEMIKEMNLGYFANVFLVKHKGSSKEYISKKMNLNEAKDQKQRKENLLYEVKLLRKLSHPNIADFITLYREKDEICLITEYLKGGTLADRVKKLKRLKEDTALRYLYDLMETLVYLEENKIVHRDIKLENIILVNDTKEASIKLIDFGLARWVDEIDFNIPCGTPGTIAPEVLSKSSYDYKIDIFSAGVVLYIMLSGERPFHGSSTAEILAENFRCEISFGSKQWSDVSFKAKGLVASMMSRNPMNRPNAKDILESIQVKKKNNSRDNNYEPYVTFGTEYLSKFLDTNHTVSTDTQDCIINDEEVVTLARSTNTYVLSTKKKPTQFRVKNCD